LTVGRRRSHNNNAATKTLLDEIFLSERMENYKYETTQDNATGFTSMCDLFLAFVVKNHVECFLCHVRCLRITKLKGSDSGFIYENIFRINPLQTLALYGLHTLSRESRGRINEPRIRKKNFLCVLLLFWLLSHRSLSIVCWKELFPVSLPMSGHKKDCHTILAKSSSSCDMMSCVRLNVHLSLIT